MFGNVYRRGDVYELKAPKRSVGHEQHGRRYGVILQSDNLPLSTVIVAPTSTGRNPASFRPEVEINGATTRVLVEQLMSIDAELRLGRWVGHLGHSDMEAISQASRILLDL